LRVLHPSVDFYRLRDIFHAVDVQACQASFPDDLARILAEIDGSIGAAQLNRDVKRALVDSCALSDPVAALQAAAGGGAGMAPELEGPPAAAAGQQARKQGKLLMHSGRYREAEPYLRAALELFYRACDGKPLGHGQFEDWSDGFHDLATLLFFAGRYGEAEHLHRRALELRERGMGPDHSLTGYSLHNLADVMAAAAEAEGWRRRGELAAPQGGSVAGGGTPAAEAEAGAEVQVAEASRSSAEGTELAELRPAAPVPAADMLGEAEALYRRCLRVRRSCYGKNHPLTAMTQAGLSRALVLQRGASLEARERKFGPQHFEVAFSLHALASWHEAAGEPAEAEALYRRAMGIRRVCLEGDHPLVADSAVALARVLLARAEDTGAMEGA
ncbi:Nephrocystin-3, partial [Tetrabaena socialis]